MPAVIQTVAGGVVTPGFSGDGGQATAAQLNVPLAVALDAAGDIYIADSGNNRIRRVDQATGIITTIAGTGTAGDTGNGGQAINAEITGLNAMLIDSAGNLYFTEPSDEVVRRINLATGVISIVAGTGTAGYSGDGGQATAARLSGPDALAEDTSSHLFISESGNNVVRQVDLSTGIITTVAGNGTAGYTGNGGQATTAELNAPDGLAVDSSGILYIADGQNRVVRSVRLSTGIIQTFAGTTFGDSGDGGLASAAQLKYPAGLLVSGNNLYIADVIGYRIREVNLSTDVITTYAGSGVFGNTGDGGAATQATFGEPYGLAMDSAGNLIIADYDFNAVREVFAATFQSNFNTPSSTLPSSAWDTVLGGGFSINGSNQAVSAPIVQGLFKAATVENLSLTNVSVSADVGLNPAPANGTSAAAVIVRSQDANDVNNCYFGALTPAPGGLDQILIEKVINGQITGIAAKALTAGTTSGDLMLEVYGNTLSAYLNGQLEVTATDNTYTTAGSAGIGAEDTGATFANVVVTALQSPSATFTDSFTRSATSDTLGNPWYVNATLPANSSTGPGGGFGINASNQAVSLTAGLNVATLVGLNFTNSANVSATVVSAGSGAGVVADWNNATQSGYALLLSGTTLQLYKASNGNLMPLGTGHAAAGSSGVVDLQVSGGTLSVYFNSSFEFSLNDSTFNSGSDGLAANGAGATFSGFSLSGS